MLSLDLKQDLQVRSVPLRVSKTRYCDAISKHNHRFALPHSIIYTHQIILVPVSSSSFFFYYFNNSLSEKQPGSEP